MSNTFYLPPGTVSPIWPPPQQPVHPINPSWRDPGWGTPHFNAILLAIAQGISASGQISAAITFASAERVYLEELWKMDKFVKETIDPYFMPL